MVYKRVPLLETRSKTMTKYIKSSTAPFKHKVTLIREPWDSYHQIPYGEVDVEIAYGDTLRYTSLEVERWERREIDLWVEDSMPVWYMDDGR